MGYTLAEKILMKNKKAKKRERERGGEGEREEKTRGRRTLRTKLFYHNSNRLKLIFVMD